MNAQEIIVKLKQIVDELDLSQSQFFGGDYSDSDQEAIELILGKFKQVECGRGALGDHDSYDTVYHFKDHNVWLEANGYYSSWEGTDWSDAEFYEVKPVKKTITVYQAVK